MRRLPRPVVDDNDLLVQASNSTRLGAAAMLRANRNEISNRYAYYVEFQGNPWHIEQVPLFQTVRTELESVYARPPVALGFIGQLRNSARGACPVCGGAGCDTLDHYLPRSAFPEFAFFSSNLVPACWRCNIVKSTKFRGDAADERPIHPYFDDIGVQRLVTLQIEDISEIPRFRLVSTNSVPELDEAVRWHIKNIIEPAGMIDECIRMWSTLIKNPILHLGRDPSPQAIHLRLLDTRDRCADMDGSINSWNSCFYDGLGNNADVVDFLATTLQNHL